MNTSTHFALYYYDACPFCQMVLRSLNNLSVKVELRNILNDPSNRQALIQGGGRSTVPCLLIENDGEEQWMYESRDIIAFLQSL